MNVKAPPVQDNSLRIIDLLRPTRKIASNTVEAIKESLQRESTTVEEILIRRKIATPDEIAKAYADFYLIPFVDTANAGDTSLASLLPEKLCRDHIIAPFQCDGETLDVAFFTPNELPLVDEIELITSCEVRPVFAPLTVIERAIAAIYDGDQNWNMTEATASSASFEEVEEEADDDPANTEAPDEVIHLDQAPPPGRDGRIIRYVNSIFEQALKTGASDVHIEHFEGKCRVRLRVDGSLNEIQPPPTSMYNAIVSRIKVLAKMDIAEKRLPQDGAIALRNEEHRVDMRVNTCPTVYGEKVVLRVLDKDAIPLDLRGLGLDNRQEKDLSESIHSPHGLMLVTGPTGSGKSTTLYACLNTLNGADVNICTVEDPVEYKFAGINQVQTRAQIGFDFASALRSFLRQDPDVIMVGEVRDGETAQICLRAALTGHFVLSTLHTNDALSAVHRLEEMDVEPFLLASTLRVIVAQRLIRRLCPECKVLNELNEATRTKFHVPEGVDVYKSGGCATCREKGYKGRVGVFEIIRITQQLSDLIQSKATVGELRESAVQQGMNLLAQSAMCRVAEGVSSLEEALSITVSDG